MEKQNKQATTKTQVFNVIILDRSGSMDYVRRAAVDGFNETLAGIKSAQKKFAETQDHFVSLVTFCSCEMKHVLDKVPADKAQPLKLEDYQPCCRTPLYDAMGYALLNMRYHVQNIEEAMVVVTIITDGLENDSREYSEAYIKQLVESLRKEGWSFTYMGANQNAAEVAATIAIRNSRNFDYNEAGVENCMEKDSKTRMNLFTKINHCKQECPSILTKETMQKLANEAFDEEESHNL